MKKFIPIFIISAVMLLSSCSSSKNASDSSAKYDAAYEQSEGMYAETSIAGSYGIEADSAKNTAPENGVIEGPSSANATSSLTSSELSAKKIIKSARLEMTAKDVNECYDKIISYVTSKGGYEFSKQMSADTDYATINAEIKIKPEELDDVIKYIGECGKVKNSNVSSDDITSQYTDTKIRLENKKKNLEKYYDFYSKADTMDEMIMIQNQIDNLTAEIECYEGQISMWNQLVSDSSISLYIQQENDPVAIKEDVEWNAISFKNMGKIMYNGFTTVVNILVSIVQWLFIVIVSISPLLIIAAVIILIIRAKIKKKNKATKETAEPSQKPEN